MELADSHCHLPLIGEHLPVDEVIADATAAGVHAMLCVAVDLQSHAQAAPWAQRYPQIRLSAGVHPNHQAGQEPDWQELRRQLADERVVAVGETGLDSFRSEGDLGWQQDRFRRHIHMAKEFGKPLIIHCREAKQDVIRILREENAQEVGGVMHCFVEDLDTARQAMDLNFYISLSGIVTFRNAKPLQQVAQELPLERLLIETDSPYLAPEPFRGKVNQPAYVRHVAEKIAQLKGLEPEDVAKRTTENYHSFISMHQSVQ